MRVSPHLDLTNLGEACETQHQKVTDHFRTTGIHQGEFVVLANTMSTETAPMPVRAYNLSLKYSFCSSLPDVPKRGMCIDISKRRNVPG